VRNAHGFSAESLEGRFDKEEAPAAGTVPMETAATEADAPAAEELPRGKEIGNLLHEILEEIDFAAVGAAAAPEVLLASGPARDLLEARMLDHHLETRWLPQVAALIWNVLNARLPDPAGGEPFRLADVPERRPELEFLFPYPGGSGAADPDGYVWGFIDLVYRLRGRYYLLDWKSNRLPAYGPAELARSMAEARYDLQYKLYAMAIDRWLASLIPDYDYEAHFGGIHYLYLRGLRPDADPAIHAPGVFSLRPAASEVRGEYAATLADLLSGAAGRVSAADLFPAEAA
jgi:exodeoxyribonuclease V beta subunit